MKKYYSLYQDIENKTADIYIYGDITSWEWYESDVSSYTLSKQLQELDESIENINVFINSYGGEVGEGIAICSMLKRHKAKVVTYVDGFACSIASVIFAAGEDRVVYNTSLGFYHNAWTYTAGNANELRKEADDLEKITQSSINAYMDCVNISEEKLREILDGETWLSAQEMVEMGFATKLIEAEEKQVATQSVRKQLFQKMTKEPEKAVATSSNIDQAQIEEMIQKAIEKSSQKLQEKQTKQQQPTNKPLNMMRALFDFKEEE